MDWENMSDIKKQLIVAMMIGSEFRKTMGVLVKKDTKIMIGDKEFHYDGPEIRATTGSIMEFGTTKEDKASYEVLEAEDNTVVLKKVVFFKAKLVTDHNSTNEYCVAAADIDEAFKTIKAYMHGKNYTRILSMNPSKFFEPLVK